MELGVLGPLQVRQYGLPVAIPGAKPRSILTLLGLHTGAVVPADTLVELLWGDDPPRTAGKALQTHISSLRRCLGDGAVLTAGAGWTLGTAQVDAARYAAAARSARDAMATGDGSQAVVRFDEALALWRGAPELPATRRGVSETTFWAEGHAALVEDRADALLATGRAAEIIGELEAAIADGPLRERRWSQLMLALYRAGRQGEALGAYQRARALLADELGVDPGPDLRRLEAAIVAQDVSLELPAAHHLSAVTRAVTFLLTDIEGSTAAWESDADAMAGALARHDEIVEQVVTFRGGRLIKTRGEGDATFSVFDRPSAAAAAAIELQEAIAHEPWALRDPMRIRVALHTGEVEYRDGDYFGRAVNRAARLRSLAGGGQILCSGATAELVVDSLSDDVVLVDLGTRQLRNLSRPEHVFELRLETAGGAEATVDAPLDRPGLPAVFAGAGPFVGRATELERLLAAWQATLTAGTRAVLIAGEPGVGKTRLAGEWSREAYEQGAVVLYGRCDEDLGAPYQPFAEALRTLVPSLGATRLREVRGVEALLPLVPGLSDALPDLAAPTRADPDTERYALFDAVVALLGTASANTPVVLVLDDLHWAAKPTLLLLRHLLRFGEHARVQILGTYRSTDLDRSHPLAAMLADLHRDGTADRLQLSGLGEEDVNTYVAEAGYDDEELARALAAVTGGNPFFLIEALRHVAESGGRWDASTLPQGVREAVSRRLTRLPAETNKALAAAAVVGSRFALTLVEHVVGDDLVDAFDEAAKAGIVIEEPGGRYRFNHAIVRQSLLAELPSVRRMRLHQRIAVTLEAESGASDDLLAELAYHYFECAWAGNAVKAVEYCRRAADQAMARLAYEGAAELYDRALHALEELDEELPDREALQAELLVARCEALLAAGEVSAAADAITQLLSAAGDSERLAAWGACFDGELTMLTHPERLDEIEVALKAAADKLAELDDAAGEAKAHTVRASCLGRLGRIGECETALDLALTAARRAREHRRVNAVLAGAPLAALWGPSPVPRAGGRCLDVVRLLRITTGSPVVEATSTRCQGVLDAFRGRAAASRQLIDSARRSLTELGMRHALLEVDQFAGIVELVADDPAAAETHLRRAYQGFRRMGLDADTAETAALLARAYLALDRADDADEFCAESERLAGHGLRASITWRTVRAQLLARRGEHDEARRVAEAAVALAERTDALVDHGEACLVLAMVLRADGDIAGAHVAAERALNLFDLKGAAALADKARLLLGGQSASPAAEVADSAPTEWDTACVRAVRRLESAADRGAWDDYRQMYAADAVIESRRKVVGFAGADIPAGGLSELAERLAATGTVRHSSVVEAVRGDRLALCRLRIGGAERAPSAPYEEILELYGLDDAGRIAMRIWFDTDDLAAAVAEMEAAYARQAGDRAPAGNVASRAYDRVTALFATRDWNAMADAMAEDMVDHDHRRMVNGGIRHGRDVHLANSRAVVEIGGESLTATVIATRGDRLALCRSTILGRGDRSDAFRIEFLSVVEVDAEDRIAAHLAFDPDDLDGAVAELDARFLAGEAAHYDNVWSQVSEAFVALNRHDIPMTTEDYVAIDHQLHHSIGATGLADYLGTSWELTPDLSMYIETVHRLAENAVLVTMRGTGTSVDGFRADWRLIEILAVDSDTGMRCEIFGEADLEAALGRFDEIATPSVSLENTASRADAQFNMLFAARRWDDIAAMLHDELRVEDRRRGLRREGGGDTELAEVRALAELGTARMSSEVLATRGERLALVHTRAVGRDPRPDAFRTDFLRITAVDADDRVTACISFDTDDLASAIDELDTRYLAGEAAAFATTWACVTEAYHTLNRHELPPTTPDWTIADRRKIAGALDGDMATYLRATWANTSDARIVVQTVHRLDDGFVVLSHCAYGTSDDGFDAEWRHVVVLGVDEGKLSHCELFADNDLDAAISRFEELIRPHQGTHNAASRMYERLQNCFSQRDWAGMAELMTPDVIQAVAAMGARNTGVTVVATRGERVALVRSRYSGAPGPQAFHVEPLCVVEIDGDGRLARHTQFDPEDLDAAFEELESRYIGGDAAEFADTWSFLVSAFSGFNRHELPPTTPDWTSVDHRRTATFATGELYPFVRASFELVPDIRNYVETVHRLNATGAVVTRVATGASREGSVGEWRCVTLVAVDGTRISRVEIFEETDLQPALARFEELSRPARQPDNAAMGTYRRLQDGYARRDLRTMSEVVADDILIDDRRSVVGAGVRRGKGAAIDEMQATAALGVMSLEPTILATRGDRLLLIRVQAGADQSPEAFHTHVINLLEVDDSGRFCVAMVFDPDDLDAAFAELDSRFLAAEAATHADTWCVIAGLYAAFNRHEPTPTNWVGVDHRRVASFPATDMTEIVATARGFIPNLRTDIASVHRLSRLGAVITAVARGTSPEGFDAEWPILQVLTVDAGRATRCEFFDEAALDAALARLQELEAAARPPATAIDRMILRFTTLFENRDWDGLRAIVDDDFVVHDRRHTINAGIRRGREAEIGDLQAASDVGFTTVSFVVAATRGERLALTRSRFSDAGDESFHADALQVIELNDDTLTAVTVFDPNDIDAAFAALDARFSATQCADRAATWSVIAANFAAVNQHRLPKTAPGWVGVDHRQVVTSAIEPTDLTAYVDAGWRQTPHYRILIEDVHRLTERGAVITHAAHGTSHAGFDAEWRTVDVLEVQHGLVSRVELFDEADLDTALARFDELTGSTARPGNAACEVAEGIWRYFSARDWTAMAQYLAADITADDRRRVVNDGVRRGREAFVEAMRALAEVGTGDISTRVVATRGQRLVLIRVRTEPEVLNLVELDTTQPVATTIVVFDVENLDAAFDELDTRFAAGEAAGSAEAWSLVAEAYAALNRREFVSTTADFVNIDHRKAACFGPGELTAFIRAAWAVTPNMRDYIEAVHRLSPVGAVVTHVAYGTSKAGFEGEWRTVHILTVDGHTINRSETFDEADLDAALARFDELSSAARLKNTATHAHSKLADGYNSRDVEQFLALHDGRYEDRRQGLRDSGTVDSNFATATLLEALPGWHWEATTLAIRGKRLSLHLDTIRDTADTGSPVAVELLMLTEVDDTGRIVFAVAFDSDGIEAAFAELDARYLAGEAATYARTWAAVADGYAAFNRRELFKTTPDWVNIDHRRGGTAFAPGEQMALVDATWRVVPEIHAYAEYVHRLDGTAAVVTQIVKATSQEGFDGEWREVILLTVDGDAISRCEVFDESEIDAALARFAELGRQAHRLVNAATRTREDLITAFGRRDLDAFRTFITPDGRYDDRRKGLRNAGSLKQEFASSMLSEAPESWQWTDEPIAVRGQRLVLCRDWFRDHDAPGRPVTVEDLSVTEISANGEICHATLFDANDIDAAMTELTTRWIATGEVEHPDTIEAHHKIIEITNHHDWDALTAVCGGATYINHRQLGSPTADYISSIRALASLTPDLWIVPAMILAHSACGVVVHAVIRGTTTDGSATEIPFLMINIVRDGHVAHIETFDPDDRAHALERFDELIQPAPLDNRRL
ncbi:BTAD domain-containing putative transcriptional regulator [Mycolicibacterium rutilum]|uniref:BTAD domain-containing putative transcriptional regulator n=1 Tax=Mycolicibacterium rutilum TaxID=370526 RepID=UPI001F227F10|nr:BTAD domain-containing putative transcriptional regulator [Mycolicibacterium rutilum]